MNLGYTIKRVASPCGLALLSVHVASGDTISVTPVYSYNETEPAAVESATEPGVYTTPTSGEVYDMEIWERPFEDGKWSDSGGVRTSSGKYYAYNDIISSSFGWDDDYMYVSFTSAGDFIHEAGKDDPDTVGLEGQYYTYFSTDPNGVGGFLIQLDKGKDAPPDTFSNEKGKVYYDLNMDVGGPGGLSVTEEGTGFTFENELDDEAVYVRRLGTTTVEFAVDFDKVNMPTDYGLNPSYLGNLAFMRTAIATSNPSGLSDLITNDAYPEAQGSGVEFDSVFFSLPEPSVALFLLCGVLGLSCQRKRTGASGKP